MGKTIAIIGAGPVGRTAAAHVMERGRKPVILEPGPTVAHAVKRWSHVPIFSPWTLNIDTAAERLPMATGACCADDAEARGAGEPGGGRSASAPPEAVASRCRT